MLLVVPIRTESVVHRYPAVNYALIAANFLCFLVFNGPYAAEVQEFQRRYLDFQSAQPRVHQFITYQFLHANAAHLLSNLIFLWVFGNSVNGKLGQLPYLLFYLAGGVFAAWGFALLQPEATHLVGASGAIAAVTTAYLALFPRSHVMVLVWAFIFIQFIEVPAMILIGLKIIVWDNIVGPRMVAAQGVAHTAHLAGYLFGFAGALVMLWVRALARDQFDILALWWRWHQRRSFSSAMSNPAARARAQWGSVARVDSRTPAEREAQERHLDQGQDLRGRISDALERRDTATASILYEQLIALDARQYLAERDQLAIARELYLTGRFTQAATAFERVLEHYPNSSERGDVRLLLGIIYARDLRRMEEADRHLTESMEALKDPGRREQCLRWLNEVRAALGRPAPAG